MKIFITGASGKIGLHLASFLIKKNYTCILNSRKKISLPKLKKKYFLYRQDILNKNFKIPNCDIVIHTAYITPEKKNLKRIKINKKIDEKIFNQIKQNRKIKKLIFISTASVYHPLNAQKKINERLGRLNNSEYAKCKIKAEKMFLRNKSIKVFNLRIPGLLLTSKETNFISNLIYNIKIGTKVKLVNKNQNFNNVLLINCLSRFILNLVKKKYKSGTILLGSSSPIKLKEVVKIISNYLQVLPKIDWKIDKKFGFYLDINKALKFYEFSSMSTKKGILKYLKTNY